MAPWPRSRIVRTLSALLILARIDCAAAELLARWNGGAGDWTLAANWTVTENGAPHSTAVPNNTPSDTFDVMVDRDDSAIVIPLGANIEIRHLTLKSHRQNSQAGISGN